MDRKSYEDLVSIVRAEWFPEHLFALTCSDCIREEFSKCQIELSRSKKEELIKKLEDEHYKYFLQKFFQKIQENMSEESLIKITKLYSSFAVQRYTSIGSPQAFIFEKIINEVSLEVAKIFDPSLKK